jgi:hypothetical protein
MYKKMMIGKKVLAIGVLLLLIDYLILGIRENSERYTLQWWLSLTEGFIIGWGLSTYFRPLFKLYELKVKNKLKK